MSDDTVSASEKAVANGATDADKPQVVEANHKPSGESPAKPNGEPEVEKSVNESPSKKASPKKGAAKLVAKTKDDTEASKATESDQNVTSEKEKSPAKSKAKADTKKPASTTTSPVATSQPLDASDSNKRERKKIERFADRVAQDEEAKARRKSAVLATSGKSLGEIERVAHFLARAEADGLKVIHGIIYDRPGSAKELHPNLRQFRGFTFEADSPDYQSRLNRLKVRRMKELKNACAALDLERGGSREEVALRIMQFLLKPVDSGRPAPQPGQKKQQQKKSAGNKRSASSPSKTAKKKKTDEISEKVEDSDESESESEAQDDAEEVEEDKKTPKKAKPAAEPKSATPKAKPKAKSTTPKAAKPKAAKAETKGSATKKRKASESESSLSDSSSDKAKTASAKKARTEKPKADDANPSNQQLAQAIESILAGADLNQTTMKVVLEQIRSRFPKMEVTAARKSFVREKVRELIVANSDAPDADAGAGAEAKAGSSTSSPQKSEAPRSSTTSPADKKKD